MHLARTWDKHKPAPVGADSANPKQAINRNIDYNIWCNAREESKRTTAVCPRTGSVEARPPTHPPLSSTPPPPPSSTATSPPCCCCWEEPCHTLTQTHTQSLSQYIHACLLSPKYTHWKTTDVNCRSPPFLLLQKSLSESTVVHFSSIHIHGCGEERRSLS